MFYNSPGTYYPKAAAGVCQNMHTNAPLGFTAPPLYQWKAGYAGHTFLIWPSAQGLGTQRRSGITTVSGWPEEKTQPGHGLPSSA